MKMIGNYIKHLSASNEPLSADVYLIDGNKYCYVYDVGNNDESLSIIEGISKDKVIILSHYHQDHVGNVDKLQFRELYVGNLTYETIGKGTVVEDSYMIHDGITIEIKHCPSPHVSGSLIVTINKEYTLIADLYFTRQVYDTALASEMLNTLESIDTKYFVVSHQVETSIFEKEYLINELKEYFNYGS